ncbi:MAG: UDP-glucose 4-epimerase GalE [Desulfobulbaceae bacterium]|nr:UDP-glucose 4-epimerase GalE [Desulfobulbaceae bacterium]
MHILVTGGAGYIGSHTCLELLNAGCTVTVVDNLLNSSRVAISRVEELCGKRINFIKLDLLDIDGLRQVFAQHLDVRAVIHFAGLKAVGESVEQPLRYYQNNLIGTLNLCQVMAEHRVKHIVFSSSATVYGTPETLPILENFPTSTTNPYGSTKLMIERILQDVHISDPGWQVVLLRYFNPVGAHPSGYIGEDPSGIPNNLMPYITQVAAGKLMELRVFGNDYPTVDGTGVRDYLHVVDLAKGHVRALEYTQKQPGVFIYNLGTGMGSSVLEMVHTFMEVNKINIPYRIDPRRPGDIAACYADPSLALRELGWKTEYGLREMCRDAWNWQKNNPDGYPEFE